ncbi:MAG: amidohydrolase [Lachnospiraceae bacterium]|nr:amidohydrolase [Lachnospiraceae bacterium]
MKIRIYNANILTMESKRDIFRGEIQIEDDKITYVGEQKASSEGEEWDRELDAGGNLLMPGFKNAHTHSGMTFLRSYADDVSLQEWLFDKIFPMEDKLTEDDIYWNSILANMEYLTSGITANFDMYMKNPAIARATKETGFRTVLCGSINDFGGTVQEIEEEYLHYNNDGPLLSYQLGFHAEYTTAREILEGMAALGQKYKAPVYTHNSETAKEVQECIERYGTTPTTFLNQLGMFEYGGGGFHCVHMSEEDLNICKEKKVWVVTNPSSNLKLASGIAPIHTMLDMGIGLAIGTDGPASNNCLDMFREMFLVTGLQKVVTSDASAVDAMDVLHMATVGGAHAMCLPDCDVLAVGKQADMIMLDLQQPNMQPINNMAKNIVYSGSKQNVKMTMIAGKILYEDGQFHIGVDPQEVYKRVNAGIQRMSKE